MQTTISKVVIFALISLLSTLVLNSVVVKGCNNDSECNYPFFDGVLNATMEGVNLVCLNGTCGCNESINYSYNETYCAPLCTLDSQCGNGVCNLTDGVCECTVGYKGAHCEELVGSQPSIPVDPCAEVKCKNGGCVNGSCVCDQGFTGAQCDQIVVPDNNNNNTNTNSSNPVVPNPIPNNNTNANNSDPIPNPSPNNNTNANSSNPIPNPPIDPCAEVKCKNGGCVNGSCVCDQGFTGPQCDQVVDLCVNVTCKSGPCVHGFCPCDMGIANPNCVPGPNPNPTPNNNNTNSNGSNPIPTPNPGPCDNVKCKNGGCVNGSCQCNQGFTGPQCDQPINSTNGGNNSSNPNPPLDPCAEVKCKNGGACVNGICKCILGFAGPQCDQVVDLCVNVTCKTGPCVHGFCPCDTGVANPDCVPPNPNPTPNNNNTNSNGSNPIPTPNPGPCDNVKCKNGGCMNGICFCLQGYTGTLCDELVNPNNTNGNNSNPCAGVKCENGFCMNGVCQCNHGYTGPLCDQSSDPCSNIHCNNGGTCLIGGVCRCMEGFYGANCENALEERCVHLVSPQSTPFCYSSGIRYPLRNIGFSFGLKSIDKLNETMLQNVKSRDDGAAIVFESYRQQNPDCTSVDCLDALKRFACVNTLPRCFNGTEQKACQSVCKTLASIPSISQKFAQTNLYCSAFPTVGCNDFGTNPSFNNSDACANVVCGANQYCNNGHCVCIHENCTEPVHNECVNVNCPPNHYCKNGNCVCSIGLFGANCSVYMEPKCENVMSVTNTPFCANVVGVYPVFNYPFLEGASNLPKEDQYKQYIMEKAKSADSYAMQVFAEGRIANPKCVSENCLSSLKKVACVMTFSPCADSAAQRPCYALCKATLSDPQLSADFVNKLSCDNLPTTNCFTISSNNNNTNPSNPNVDKCQGITCSGRGICSRESGACTCFDGYEGGNCETKVFRCFGFSKTDSDVCSGRGTCISSDKCECKSGYKGKNCEEADCSPSCKNGGYCFAPNQCKCQVGFGLSDCSSFTPTPGCISVMSSQDTPFCNAAGVNHPLYNLNLIPSSVLIGNKTHFEDRMKFNIRQLDKKAEEESNAQLNSLPDCTSSNCKLQVRRFNCYNTFKVCLGLNQNSAPLCRGACETLVDQAGAESLNTTKDSFCNNLPISGCSVGVFVSDSTTCFGKSFKSGDVCNSKGKCIGPNQCSCFYGYTGEKCQVPICYGKSQDDAQACGGKGKCIAPNTCNCRSGASGLQCDIPTCNGKTEQAGGCSFNGQCADVDTCKCRGNYDPNTFCFKCKQGYTGPNCEIPICFNIPANDKGVCSGRGSCEGPQSCKCSNNGYSGSACQSFSCYGFERNSPQVCGGNGKCVGPDTCTCETAWNDGLNCTTCSPAFKGPKCKERVCSDDVTCGGKGKCNGLKCVCNGNYAGEFCDKCISGFVGANCSISCNPSTCNGRGKCKDDGSCECKNSNSDPLAKCAPGKCINNFEGDNCDYKFDTSSLKFNANGDKLTATVYSSLKRPIPCDQIFQDISDLLGEKPKCIFNGDKNSLDIVLGTKANIVPSLLLKTFSYPGSKDTNNVTVLDGEFTSAAPTASLVGDKNIISTCDELFLNAYGSVSLDRRPLSFSWSVSSGPSIDDADKLDGVIKNEERGSLRIKMSDIGLSAGTYIVDVTVTSKFGKSDTKSFSFTLVANAVPSVFIKQGTESKFMVGSISTITPIVQFPTCYNGDGTIEYAYTLDASQSASTVSIQTKNGMLVLGKGYTDIKVEGTYYFTVTATANNAQPSTTSFKVTATAQPLSISYTIDDIIQSVEEPISFSIDIVDPSNTNDVQNVSMTCYDLSNSQDCTIQPGLVSTFSSSQFTSGSYVFTTTVSKGSRVAYRKLYVTLLDQSKNALLKVSITSNVDLTVVDPAQNLYLTYSTWGVPLTSPSFEWTAENFELDSNAVTTASYLKISSSLLSPGDTYTISLKVVDGEKEGTAKISFTVNTPPTQGQFDVYPTSGKAASDIFDIKCGNGWSDPQTPLTYQFMYFDKADDEWNPLTDRTEDPSASITLPLPSEGNVLTVKAVVYDALGASSFSTFDVTVNKPSSAESISALSAMASSKGTLTLGATTSAMSLFTSVNATTLNSAQVNSIKQAASSIVDSFLGQQAKAENITSVSKASSENGFAFASSFSGSVSSGMVSDTTTSKVVDMLASTTSSVFGNGIEIRPEMIEMVRKSADKFLDVILKGQLRKRVFSKVDLSNINSVYTNLASLSIKDTIADLPSTVVVASGVTTLTRKVNVATLNALSETISGKNKIKLSAKFSQLAQLASSKTVNVMVKVLDVATGAANNSITKAIDFKLVDGSSLTVSNASSIADLVFERLKNSRSMMGSITTTCKVLNPNTNTYETASGCTLTTNSDSTITASVASTGTYLITSETQIDPVPATSTVKPSTTPTTPKKSTHISASSNIGMNVVLLLLAMFVAVIV